MFRGKLAWMGVSGVSMGNWTVLFSGTVMVLEFKGFDVVRAFLLGNEGGTLLRGVIDWKWVSFEGDVSGEC